MVDTSVLIEIILEGSPYMKTLEELFREAERGAKELYITPLTVSELLYVAYKIYKSAGTEDPKKDAEDFVNWVLFRAELAKVGLETAIIAGKIKEELGLSLADCYVLATFKQLEAKPLFLKPGGEMREKMEQLEKMGIILLDGRS
ncbi:MAG: PIN domain nuclease [Fervidicoccus sp.]|nr:MAG: PIN domain nuclease [Fervidicoccus sp.]